MHYYDVGQGEVLLFGHSLFWDHQMWHEQIAKFSSRYRCIAPDLWGHGLSDSTDEPISVQSLADDCWHLMKNLDVDQFSLIGHSAGAMWGCQMALSHPDAVKRLVMIDSFVGKEVEVTQAIHLDMLDDIEAQQRVPSDVSERMVENYFSPFTSVRKPAVIERFQNALNTIPSDNISTIVTMGRAVYSREDILKQLGNLALPAVVVVGENNRPYPMRMSQIMVQRLQKGELLVIPFAGYFSCVENSESVNRALNNFLMLN